MNSLTLHNHHHYLIGFLFWTFIYDDDTEAAENKIHE